MHVLTLQLVFASPPGQPCRKHRFCACSCVLIDTQPLPVIEPSETFSESVLQDTEAALQPVGGLSRLLVCYSIFLHPTPSGLQASRHAASVQYKLMHRYTSTSNEPEADQRMLAELPVDFLTACTSDLIQREKRALEAYSALIHHDLRAWQTTFSPQAVKGARFDNVDFTEGSGVACISPRHDSARVHLTLPVELEVCVQRDLITDRGSFVGLAAKKSPFYARVCLPQRRHASLIAPGAVRIDVCHNTSHATPQHVFACLPQSRLADPAYVSAMHTFHAPALPMPRFLGAKPNKKRKRDADGTDELLEVLLGQEHGAQVRAACAAFGSERDAHEFAVVLGAVQGVWRIVDRLWHVAHKLVHFDPSWAADLLQLHHVTVAEPPPQLCAKLAAVLVPMIWLEVVYDVFAEGPFCCVRGATGEHGLLIDVSAAVRGPSLVPELVARGRYRADMSLQEQREALVGSVYQNLFCGDSQACRVVAEWRGKRGRDGCVGEMLRIARTWRVFLEEHGTCVATRADVAEAVLEVVRGEL